MVMPRVFAASLVCMLAFACAPPQSMVDDSSSPQAGAFADSVRSGTANLHGTLLVPANARPPVVLIIAGSGPTDRDGNSPLLAGKNNSLRYLAEALAGRGIASLRYDKRGIGQSAAGMAGMRESDLRFDNFVDDATAWGKKLATDRRFSSVVVIGHSEGSLIGMLAAPVIPASRVVSIAGAGVPAGAAIIRQLTGQVPPALLAQATSAVQGLERGETVDTVPQVLYSLFRPSVQPYMISWFKHDPGIVAGRLTVPLLIIQGTHDIQTLEDDARAIAAGNPRATLTLIPGMNHVLKQSPAGRAEQLPVYSDSTIAIDPTLVDAIARFVLSGPSNIGEARPIDPTTAGETLAIRAATAAHYGQDISTVSERVVIRSDTAFATIWHDRITGTGVRLERRAGKWRYASQPIGIIR